MNFLFFNFLNDGGPTFMYPTLLMLLICIVLIVKVFLKGDSDGKTISLIKHISLFALVWGFLGFFVGLIDAFDAISRATDINQRVLAGGLKIGLLSPSFGIITFLVARLGIIALLFKKK